MKLAIRQILKGEVFVRLVVFLGEQPEQTPANVLYTPFGQGWESHSPGPRAHPIASYLPPVPTLPAPLGPPAGSWSPASARLLLYMGRGRRRVPCAERRSRELIREREGSCAAQSAQPARSAFSEALSFREITSARPGPRGVLFSLYSGDGGGGGCPKDGPGVGASA